MSVQGLGFALSISGHCAARGTPVGGKVGPQTPRSVLHCDSSRILLTWSLLTPERIATQLSKTKECSD